SGNHPPWAASRSSAVGSSAWRAAQDGETSCELMNCKGSGPKRPDLRGPSRIVARAGEQGDDGDEQGRADNRPDDREGHVAGLPREWLGQVQRAGDPHAEEGPDEAQCDRRQTPAARVADDGLPQGATETGDDQKHDQLQESDVHNAPYHSGEAGG